MSKDKISEYDANAANNTDVNGTNIAEGCAPSGINNAIREVMAALKRFETGSDGDSITVGGNLVVSGTSTLGGTTIPASKTLLVSTDIGSTVQGYDAQLADIAGLTPTDGNFIVGNGTNFVSESGATARTSLGLGSIATQAADNVNIDGGAIDGTTIGGSSAAVGTFTTVGATTGNITDVNATTVDTTNLEVTNLKAKDGTASATIANITGKITVAGQMTVDGIEIGQGAGNIATNTAVGVTALNAITSGIENTAFGYLAGLAITTGSQNTAIGNQALITSTTSGGNTAIGQAALRLTTTGNENTGVGRNCLTTNTTGAANTAIGWYALYLSTTGSNNIGIGLLAGDAITTGVRNTIIGNNSDPSAADAADQTVLGEGLTGKGNDTAFIGGTNGAYNEKNVTTWETTSDQRIKKNIVDNNEGLEKILAIRVRNFEYKLPEEISDGLKPSDAISKTGTQLGVIAQEIQQVLPDCVTENSTGVLSVSTDPLVWHLINAVKELKSEIDALKIQLNK